MSNSQHVQFPGYSCRVFRSGNQLVSAEALQTSDPDEVWHETAMSSCELIRQAYGRMTPGFEWRMEVLNPAGKVIYQFSFKAEAFEP